MRDEGRGTKDEGGEGAMGNLEHRILNDEGDLSCIFLLHRYQLFWVCFFSHCIAVVSLFSIAISTAELRSKCRRPLSICNKINPAIPAST